KGYTSYGLLSFIIRDSSDIDHELNYNISNWKAEEWHHITATWNTTTGNIKLYIDRELKANSTETFDITSLPTNLYIGTNYQSKYQADAVIDNFQILSNDNYTVASYYNQTDNTASNIGKPHHRYVQVRALLETNNSNVTPTLHSITIKAENQSTQILNQPPTEPTIQTPTNNTVTDNFNPTLTWNASTDQDNDSTYYGVELATLSTFNNPTSWQAIDNHTQPTKDATTELLEHFDDKVSIRKQGAQAPNTNITEGRYGTGLLIKDGSLSYQTAGLIGQEGSIELWIKPATEYNQNNLHYI
ncbi:hypothetical protein COT48_03450, partial [Candidatus Woesearchaeota archaeon CG08_land_8_20_14_0_20_47_9]